MSETITKQEFVVREATSADIESLVRQRCEMFKDIGRLPISTDPTYIEAVRAYYQQALPAGEYVGFVASPAEQPDLIVAGAGLQRRYLLPSPNRDGQTFVAGLEVLVLNVYTEPAWRRRGLAELIMRRVLEWCRANGAIKVVLHASDMGRPVYEKLGFVGTNEMRFEGQL